MEYIAGSYARFTAVRPISDVDAVSLLGKPGVGKTALLAGLLANQLSTKLSRYYDKATGSTFDAYPDHRPVTRLIAGSIARAWGWAGSLPNNESIKIDFTPLDASVEVVPAFNDASAADHKRASASWWSALYRSISKKLSAVEQELRDPATLERLEQEQAARWSGFYRPKMSTSALWALSLALAAPVTPVEDEGRGLAFGADIRRVLLRRALVLVRRMLGRTSVRLTHAALAAADVDYSIESHRSRAPGSARKTLPSLVFRELAAV
ncbi:hypothetical protein ACGF3C_32955 [Micromonospora sp. NPDC047762]|uniref:hypothetical protein n=1 Tax=Micromonospora sp. NPDC047762 TaxID=3364255 RepID=UPI00371C19D6